jgi:hypothetical protein
VDEGKREGEGERGMRKKEGLQGSNKQVMGEDRGEKG